MLLNLGGIAIDGVAGRGKRRGRLTSEQPPTQREEDQVHGEEEVAESEVCRELSRLTLGRRIW